MLQLCRTLSILKNGSRLSFLEQMQRQWTLFAEKPPKGFEKFFKPGGAKGPPKSSSGKDGKPAEARQASSGKTAQPPPPPPSSGRQNMSPWSFGAFGPNTKGGSSGGGKPFEGGDRDKWIVVGIISALGLFGAMSLFEVGNKEITWREFVYR